VSLPHRPLDGCVINLSIAGSDDGERLGFPTWQVNRITLQVVAALFGQGASMVFGHDWREDGVMEAVYGFARQMQPPIPLSQAAATAEGRPLLRNLVPWPDSPHLPGRDLERLSSTLRVEAAGLPEELHRFDNEARSAEPHNALYRYVRARGLTFLRHRLDETCHARLCFGGRRSGSAGRYPGVIEEAVLALRSNKPLYLSGLLGGATQQVVDAIERKKMADDFCRPAPLEALYENPPIKEVDQATHHDRIIDRTAIWNEFTEAGREKLAATNGLTIEENDQLFHTPVLGQVIEIVLIGLSRIWPNLAQRIL
jgi:hypothetical protein